MTETSIVTFGQLANLRKKYARKKIVLMGGGFDLIHPGHVKQLAWAKSQGDILIVHITGERRFIEKKGRKPLFPERERAQIIASMKPVDHVFVYNGKHYDADILGRLRPDVLAFNKEAYETAKNEVRKTEHQAKIAVSKFKKNYSSNSIRKEIITKRSEFRTPE